MTATLPTVVARITSEALQLASLLTQAEAIQWQPSMTPKPREDTTERAKGGHSDPTLNTVVDERRLAVRAAVVTSDRILEELAKRTAQARLTLEIAIDEWNGNTP